MSEPRTAVIVSDIHYAGALEKARGWREAELINNAALRIAVHAFRHFIWRRDPFAHNHLLDRFCEEIGRTDYVIANGDYSCDTAFVGVSDAAAFQSAEECLALLRKKFGARLYLTIGDHELGKRSLFGGVGGMRLRSWHRATRELGLKPFWKISLDHSVLIGITSSLVALPVYLPETLIGEREEWERLRAQHLREIEDALGNLQPHQHVVLFCHDPTALPFLWRETQVRSKADQIAQTVIGHLHSRLFLWQSRLLSGMPTVSVFGYSIRRMSATLREARYWRPFNIRLCPALAGIQLLNDGGYCRLEIRPHTRPNFSFHCLGWKDTGG